MIRTRPMAVASPDVPPSLPVTSVSAMRATWRLGWTVALVVSLLLTLTGCALLYSHRVIIPTGAHVGHIVISGDTLTIDPSTVPAGDVYFAVDGPADGLGFVTGGADGPATPPLTDDDVTRLARGDRQGFSYVYGMVGEDDIVYFLGLSPGKYAFILDPDGGDPGEVPRAMAILTVLP
jgi:hypothetical protein